MRPRGLSPHVHVGAGEGPTALHSGGGEVGIRVEKETRKKPVVTVATRLEGRGPVPGDRLELE